MILDLDISTIPLSKDNFAFLKSSKIPSRGFFVSSTSKVGANTPSAMHWHCTINTKRVDSKSNFMLLIKSTIFYSWVVFTAVLLFCQIPMIIDVFEQLGFPKNEAKIYEVLLRDGECTVGHIVNLTGVHRRNVYDTLYRLREKGLAFEVIGKHEYHYKASDPHKLRELVEQKQQALDNIMPQLTSLYHSTPRTDEMYRYQGTEGWRAYMRAVLDIAKTNHIIAGQGSWHGKKMEPHFNEFLSAVQAKNIGFQILFDHEIKAQSKTPMEELGNVRFFPPQHKTPIALDTFGDHVVIFSPQEDEEKLTFTFIVNQQIAEAFQAWFALMWEFCKPR